MSVLNVVNVNVGRVVMIFSIVGFRLIFSLILLSNVFRLVIVMCRLFVINRMVSRISSFLVVVLVGWVVVVVSGNGLLIGCVLLELGLVELGLEVVMLVKLGLV